MLIAFCCPPIARYMVMRNMDAATATLIAAVAVAAINMIGSVLIMWIRAIYKVETKVNGHAITDSKTPGLSMPPDTGGPQSP